MRVNIPSPLRSYTNRAAIVEAEGRTIAELLDDLERRFRGIRFRMISEQDAIREHIRIFVNGELQERLDAPLRPEDEIHIICAISGG